jgi:hypothetical protein
MLQPVAAAKKKKDRIDAHKLADCLRSDFLPPQGFHGDSRAAAHAALLEFPGPAGRAAEETPIRKRMLAPNASIVVL